VKVSVGDGGDTTSTTGAGKKALIAGCRTKVTRADASSFVR
jgi:hypothetical protein